MDQSRDTSSFSQNGDVNADEDKKQSNCRTDLLLYQIKQEGPPVGEIRRNVTLRRLKHAQMTLPAQSRYTAISVIENRKPSCMGGHEFTWAIRVSLQTSPNSSLQSLKHLRLPSVSAKPPSVKASVQVVISHRECDSVELCHLPLAHILFSRLDVVAETDGLSCGRPYLARPLVDYSAVIKTGISARRQHHPRPFPILLRLIDCWPISQSILEPTKP